MRDHLNQKVKYREEFRPFGPVVTEEEQFRFFELKQESPFMLLAANVRNEYRRRLAAITHVDGTARPQAVSKAKDGFTHYLLRSFERWTGYPVLLNTSFNLNDEPIVETPRDAVSTFMRSRLDVLVLENELVVKTTSPEPSSR
jgi:carbamoyltransferase